MKPQTLTLRDVIIANFKAFYEKRLGAQIPKEEFDPTDPCLYRYNNGCGCAIGVALDEGTIGDLIGRGYNAMSFKMLLEKNLVEVPNPEEIDLILLVQRAHDRWAVGGNEATFAELLTGELYEFVSRLPKDVLVFLVRHGTHNIHRYYVSFLETLAVLVGLDLKELPGPSI